MKHLSTLDAAFPHLDSAEMPMHAGSQHRSQPSAGCWDGWREDLTQHVCRRTHPEGRSFKRNVRLSRGGDWVAECIG